MHWDWDKGGTYLEKKRRGGIRNDWMNENTVYQNAGE
jgi:hypothetical protein